MKTQKFNNITVRRYLRNEMSRQEEAAFKKILQDDPEFAAKVALDKQLIKGTQLGLHVRPSIEYISPRPVFTKKTAPARPYKLKNAYVWGAFGAAIALLIATVFLLVGSRIGAASLFSQHYRPYLDRSLATDTKFQIPIEAYENGYYEQAVQGMNQILFFEPENEVAHFYKGLAFLGSGREKDAIKHLTIASNLMEFSERGAVLYYLGLAYLKNGDEDSAKKAFEELNAFDNLFRDESRAILETF